MVSTGAVVEFDRVGKLYSTGWFGTPPLLAVREVSLALQPGWRLGLLGPNRAGKTTLLKILLGVTRPTSGQVTRFGQPARCRESLGRIGYVHENHAFPKYLSANDVMHYYGTLSGVPAATLRKRVPELLERVGLADRSREPIGRFSKGMTQRLGLAQALVNDPDLLALDEPTEGLDFEGRRAIRTIVDELKAAGKTIILVSHVLSEINLLCDHLAVLREGRTLYVGTKDGLLQGRPFELALEELYLQADRT
jgi:ABC-2 type transport system ATP-binding protein